MSTPAPDLHSPEAVRAPAGMGPELDARAQEEERRVGEALAEGYPLLVWRDPAGALRIFVLGADGRVTIGRRADCNVVIEDELVSRAHATLEPVAGDWALLDGISLNGTFVNGEKIVSRRLVDRDCLLFGNTEITYRRSLHKGSVLTTPASSLADARTLTNTQRAVLTALARPCKSGTSPVLHASDSAIAKEVHLSLDAVRGHLDVLCRRFEIADPTGAQRRVRLIECAFEWGLISESDLG